MTLYATQFEALEWSYTAPKAYPDPFNKVEMDVEMKHTSGQTWRIPAYWSGGDEWRVRFAPPLPGSYAGNAIWRLPDQTSHPVQTVQLEAVPYQGHPR